jgi:hypothetical protein
MACMDGTCKGATLFDRPLHVSIRGGYVRGCWGGGRKHLCQASFTDIAYSPQIPKHFQQVPAMDSEPFHIQW